MIYSKRTMFTLGESNKA